MSGFPEFYLLPLQKREPRSARRFSEAWVPVCPGTTLESRT
jgi:hypothetical protein